MKQWEINREWEQKRKRDKKKERESEQEKRECEARVSREWDYRESNPKASNFRGCSNTFSNCESRCTYVYSYIIVTSLVSHYYFPSLSSPLFNIVTRFSLSTRGIGVRSSSKLSSEWRASSPSWRTPQVRVSTTKTLWNKPQDRGLVPSLIPHRETHYIHTHTSSPPPPPPPTPSQFSYKFHLYVVRSLEGAKRGVTMLCRTHL